MKHSQNIYDGTFLQATVNDFSLELIPDYSY